MNLFISFFNSCLGSVMSDFDLAYLVAVSKKELSSLLWQRRFRYQWFVPFTSEIGSTFDLTAFHLSAFVSAFVSIWLQCSLPPLVWFLQSTESVKKPKLICLLFYLEMLCLFLSPVFCGVLSKKLGCTDARHRILKKRVTLDLY